MSPSKINIKKKNTIKKGEGSHSTLRHRRPSEALIGREGIALTRIIKIGRVKIGKEIYEAISTYGSIKKGSTVVVAGIRMHQLLVDNFDSS